MKKFLNIIANVFKSNNKNTEAKVQFRNQPCYDKDGNMIGWLSRAIAVATALFAQDENGKWYVLVSERGKGTPDPEYIGAYNAMCGYLDYDETIINAAMRETREETGVVIDTSLIRFDVLDNPNENKRQNIVFRYYGILPHLKEFYEAQFTHDGNEPDEVGEIKFIDIEKLDEVRWAFGHRQFIQEVINMVINGNKEMNPYIRCREYADRLFPVTTQEELEKNQSKHNIAADAYLQGMRDDRNIVHGHIPY